MQGKEGVMQGEEECKGKRKARELRRNAREEE
jgi:hypothetical protein